MFHKNSIAILLIFFLCHSTMHSQAIKVQACARTTDVSPVKDGNGNDRRHLSAFYLDYIHVMDFGVVNPKNYARYGMSGGEKWEDDIWVSGCQSNQTINSCNGCNTCINPTFVSGRPGGQIIGDIENNVRVRSENNDIIIEATNEKDVCYETPWINADEAEGKFLLVDVGYQGTTTNSDTRTMNIKLNYMLLDDGVVRNFMNKWSNFERRQSQDVRTVLLTNTSELDKDVDIQISPNPVGDILRLSMESPSEVSLDLSIVEMSGKSVMQRNVAISPGANSDEWNVRGLAPGHYILTLTDGTRSAFRQFIKN